MTDNRLSSVRFCQDDITKIIQKLDPNKAHGHYNINIHILKICGSSIYKHLEVVFTQCIETGVFPSEWKNGNIVPTHKKGDKQTVKNIVQCLYYLFVEIFLKNYFLTKCLFSSLKINLFHQISPV